MNNKTKVLPKILAVDFDGTLCKGDNYPNIGQPNLDIIELVQSYRQEGWRIVLWTCRNREALEAAVKWCAEQGLVFDAVNENIPEVQEMFGGDTRKVFADKYLDDKNIIVPSLRLTDGN